MAYYNPFDEYLDLAKVTFPLGRQLRDDDTHKPTLDLSLKGDDSSGVNRGIAWHQRTTSLPTNHKLVPDLQTQKRIRYITWSPTSDDNDDMCQPPKIARSCSQVRSQRTLAAQLSDHQQSPPRFDSKADQAKTFSLSRSRLHQHETQFRNPEKEYVGLLSDSSTEMLPRRAILAQPYEEQSSFVVPDRRVYPESCADRMEALSTTADLSTNPGQTSQDESLAGLMERMVLNVIERRFGEAPQRPSQRPVCVFCQRNGEAVEFYTTHVIKDTRGKVICPVLRKYVCTKCQATGDNAHTLRHCPSAREEASQSDTFRTKRTSCGLRTSPSKKRP